ncbi:MAG: lytic transglycosylase domain-containing protein [Firmicutes bacterium]|nr:lytic transglycosylase domain-containing protein [Bacillota bacterium]
MGGPFRGRVLWLALALFLAAALLVKPALRWLFPIQYAREIAAAAREADLDPFLVAAVVHAESGFRPRAVSVRGARGLMQLMPDTASWIAGQLGLETPHPDRLFEPELNLRLGAWYLQHLVGEFQGNELAALAAYNAGRARVSQWLADGTWDGRKDTLDRIPFAETRGHVRRVLFARDAYRWLYGDGWWQVLTASARTYMGRIEAGTAAREADRAARG